MGEIRGYCAVIQNPDGAIVAEATDFAPSEAAGFTAQERQVLRVRGRAQLAFARNHLNHWMAENLDQYFAREFFEHAEKCGYKMHVFQIGETGE